MKPDRSAFILAAIIAFLGLSPHLFFSLQMKELLWFKGAFDEDYYTLVMLNEEPRRDRIISTGLMRSFTEIYHGNLDLAHIVSDTLLPPLCVIAAYICACGITRNRTWRWALTLALIFGSDLLVTTNQAVNNSFSIRTIKAWLPSSLQPLLPITDSIYFQLFRTPEPQTSWIIFFLFLAFLSRIFALRGARLKISDWIILFLFFALFPYVYIFCVIPTLMLLLFLGVGMVFRGQTLSGLALMAILLLGLFLFIGWGPIGQKGALDSVGFSSRIPSVTPALLLAICLITIELWTVKMKIRLPDTWFGLSALAVPIVLLNQQVVTGMMTSVRDWERYTCYVLVVFGSCHLQSVKFFFRRLIKRYRFTPVLIVAIFFFILVRGQLRNYGSFTPYNRLSVTQWNLIRDVAAKSGSRDFRVLIDNQYLCEPLLQVRSGNTLEFVHSYTELMVYPIRSIVTEDKEPVGRSHHQEKAFESLAREGVSPEQLLIQMREDVKFHRHFRHLIAFFALKDSYEYYTDDRGIHSSVLFKQIEPIVVAYEKYLQGNHATWNRPVLYVTTVKPAEAINNIWTNQLIDSRLLEGQRRITRLYAYVQKLKRVPES